MQSQCKLGVLEELFENDPEGRHGTQLEAIHLPASLSYNR
jgi:hypothetical protein